MSTITPEEFAQLQKKFSEIKLAINSALAVMMALSEMSRRRPDYSEKLASTVLTKAPQIASSLKEFTQALNEKAGPIMSNSAHNISHEEIVELQKKFSEIKFAISSALVVMVALSEMSRGRPDWCRSTTKSLEHYSEKLASTVLTKAPQIVSSLQEFTQALNEGWPDHE